MVKAKGKAGAKSAGFCMYIGPSIVGTIQQARILYLSLIHISEPTRPY